MLGKPGFDALDDLGDAAAADFVERGDLLVGLALDFGQAEDVEGASRGHARGTGERLAVVGIGHGLAFLFQISDFKFQIGCARR
jgi:hypothetical protein